MPASLVIVVRRTPVSVCVSATLALVVTAPEGSVTVPDTVPRLVWACAATASVKIEIVEIRKRAVKAQNGAVSEPDPRRVFMVAYLLRQAAKRNSLARSGRK